VLLPKCNGAGDIALHKVRRRSGETLHVCTRTVYEPAARSDFSNLINLSISPSDHHTVSTCRPTLKMGFTFKGLTSNALASAPAGHTTSDKDVADVPAAVDGHTSMDVSHPDEKLGTPRSVNSMSGSDDEELNKIDTTAESGVQAVQAATHVWTKRDLIIAYIV
jgi:hypothetical protein